MGKLKFVTDGSLVAMACLALASACADDAEDQSAAAGGAGYPAADAPSAQRAVTYAADIQPILLAQCSPCHATLNLGDHNAAMSYSDAVERASDIVDAIASGAMPVGMQGCNGGAPGDPGCLSADEFVLIQQWVEGGTPE